MGFIMIQGWGDQQIRRWQLTVFIPTAPKRRGCVMGEPHGGAPRGSPKGEPWGWRGEGVGEHEQVPFLWFLEEGTGRQHKQP